MFVPKIKYYTFVTVKILRKIAIVLVPLYWLLTWLYHRCFDWGLFKSKSFNHPVICVGNLVVGGTGKSPMIEYLINLLQSHYSLATLSRGYKRTSKGFVLADHMANAETIGDEPLQFYKKFKNLIVAVDESRVSGISKLLKLNKKPEVIFLDDAFQHRQVKAGINILLTAYNALYTDDMLLPTGNLREPMVGAKRAQIIVVTKCPPQLSDAQKTHVERKLKLQAYQSIYFSTIQYSEKLINSQSEIPLESLSSSPFTLVTGIANPKPLLDFLNTKGFAFEHLSFSDHHQFTDKEISILAKREMIVTTEKDFVRLQPKFLSNERLYYLPIRVAIHNESEFNNAILTYVQDYYSIEA